MVSWIKAFITAIKIAIVSIIWIIIGITLISIGVAIIGLPVVVQQFLHQKTIPLKLKAPRINLIIGLNLIIGSILILIGYIIIALGVAATQLKYSAELYIQELMEKTAQSIKPITNPVPEENEEEKL